MGYPKGRKRCGVVYHKQHDDGQVDTLVCRKAQPCADHPRPAEDQTA